MLLVIVWHVHFKCFLLPHFAKVIDIWSFGLSSFYFIFLCHLMITEGSISVNISKK